MHMRKLTTKTRAVAVGAASLTALIGFGTTAPVTSADVYSSYTFALAPEGSMPTGPRFFEGFSNTVNVAGSETAEYALEQVGALYNNAGIFGCNQNGDKRTCNVSTPPSYGSGVLEPGTAILPSTDIYDNFDHDVINNAQAVGSAAGVADLCATPTSQLPHTPSPIPATWPYYTYPVPSSTEGADGIPIDLVRASASISDLSNHGVATCTGLAQQGIASDAVVGLTFSPLNNAGNPGLPDGTAVEDPAYNVQVASDTPLFNIDFSNTGGSGTTGGPQDTAWRVFCAPATNPLSITTWDQLYAAEGIPQDDWPTPDQAIDLWGTKTNSGTGATWYTFSGCGTGNGNIKSDHLITENDAQQLSQYSAQLNSETVALNTTGCNATTSPACTGGTSPVIPAASSTLWPSGDATINCGDGTGDTGLGTSGYTSTAEKCVAQAVADSIFFMSYGYTASHPYTASVTIPTASAGSQPDYFTGTNYEVEGYATTIAGKTVNGQLLGQPGAGLLGDPRSSNTAAVPTGRDLYLDYLTSNVRASAAAFVNWVCDEGDQIEPKGVDETTGVPYDTEITQDIGAWGYGRLSCDGGTGAYGAAGATYTSPITAPVIDPGPFNNE
jgi:hypothetical protein